MKIVYVTVSFPFGAGETFLIPEIQELIATGHRVLIVPVRPQGKIIHGDAVRFAEFAIDAPLFSARILWDGVAEFCRAFTIIAPTLRILLGRSITLAAANTAIIPKGLWLSKMARRWGADHIHAYWASSVASLALIAAECAGITWSFTAHRHDIAGNNLLGEKARRAAFVRVISKSGLRMSESTEGSLGDKASVLHIGVPLPQLRDAAARTRRLVAVCPANLVAVKGHRYLLEAMAILHGAGVDMELWVVGDGDLRPELEKHARQMNLGGQVRFLGRISHQTLLSWYENGEVDIVVLPSVDLGNGHHEGIPVALMEAMSYAIPVVATATGGMSELIGNGAGLLVAPANPQALAAGLRQLACSSERRKSLGLAGRKRVERSFEITRAVAELVRRFHKAVSTGSAAAPQSQLLVEARQISIPNRTGLSKVGSGS